MNTVTKQCSKCGVEKPIAGFYARKESKDGYINICKKCHLKKCREWVTNNKGRHAKNGKEWRKNNKERSNAICKKYRDSNPDKRYAICTKWRKDNPEKSSEIQKRNYRKRYADPMKKLNYLIRGGIAGSITKGTKNNRHWENLVGYTVDDLKKHLESLWLPGMSWDNYSKYGWHIDHIFPLSRLILNGPDDPTFKFAWSLANLQPLWAKDNLSKSDLTPEEWMRSKAS